MSGALSQAWALQNRANEKVRRARAMMPFLRTLVKAAGEIELNFDREEVLLDLESVRDCLMEEVKNDPELDDDGKVMMANLVSGISKNWSRIQGFIYEPETRLADRAGGSAGFGGLFALAFVTVGFFDIMFQRYKVRVTGLTPELEGLSIALGLESPTNGP